MCASEVFFQTLAKLRHRSAADNLPKSKADPARSNRRSLASLVECVLRRRFFGVKTSSEWQIGNVPSCSVVTKAARTGCAPNKGHSLNDKGPGRERRPKWRLLQGSKLTVWMQNDRIFASPVECVLRRSFSEHWRKNGIDPWPTTYQSRRPTRQGQTVDLLSVRGPKKKAEMLVGALPERIEPRN